jgi:hypothetical protein
LPYRDDDADGRGGCAAAEEPPPPPPAEWIGFICIMEVQENE